MAPTPVLAERRVTGILLAAGRGARFDPSGERNKLLQTLPDGHAVAVAAASSLLVMLPSVVAVVRPGADALAAQLQQAGCEVTVCIDAEQGMAASLVHGLRCARESSGWLIALADMPSVTPSTIASLIDAIDNGADIAVPVYRGKRGNPVAFSRVHLARLLALGGDEGARALLKSFPVTEVQVDDPGIRYDIDTESDLRAMR
ncbi:MAG: nucleotidyltransferase family protein [Herminiimonas sp.]|nr:nucleotidyltransferase family protein [Herminiimonas sp.]